jgi:hypothetical protein
VCVSTDGLNIQLLSAEYTLGTLEADGKGTLDA